jgi:hypothetical protein
MGLAGGVVGGAIGSLSTYFTSKRSTDQVERVAKAGNKHQRTMARKAREQDRLASAYVALVGMTEHDEVLAEDAGITAGSWYAWPSTHMGYELVAAGMLIMAGGHDGKPLDFDELERWTREGYERGFRSRKGER